MRGCGVYADGGAMALRLVDGSVLLHIPRTGGTFAAAVLDELGLVDGKLGAKHDCPDILRLESGRRSFVFVRHPVSWICSVYGWLVDNSWTTWPRKNQPWHPFIPIGNAARGSIDDFVRWVARNKPGFVSGVFRVYTDWPDVKVMFTETLKHDVGEIAARLGKSRDDVAAAMGRCEGSRNASSTKRMISLECLSAFLAEEQYAMRWYL